VRGGAAAAAAPARDATAAPPASAPTAPGAKRKLGYKDQRELDGLPARIDALETRIAELGAGLQDPATYQRGGEALATLHRQLTEAQAELDAAYARWAELEG